MLLYTQHAIERCIQRRIYDEDIRMVLSQGEEIRSNEQCRTLRRGKLFVVMSNVNNAVVTAYRRYSVKTMLRRKKKMQRKKHRVFGYVF